MPINFNVGTFFDKFKNAALKEMSQRQVIADCIEKNTGVKLSVKEVSLKNSVIRIQTNPAARNHIFMKKELVLNDIKTQLNGFIIIDLQ